MFTFSQDDLCVSSRLFKIIPTLKLMEFILKGIYTTPPHSYFAVDTYLVSRQIKIVIKF